MVLNPEPNLRPLSIRRDANLSSDHHPGNYPPQAGHTFSSSTRTPASEAFHHTITRDPDGEVSRPKTKSTTTEDSRLVQEKTAIDCHYNCILETTFFTGHP